MKKTGFALSILSAFAAQGVGESIITLEALSKIIEGKFNNERVLKPTPMVIENGRLVSKHPAIDVKKTPQPQVGPSQPEKSTAVTSTSNKASIADKNTNSPAPTKGLLLTSQSNNASINANKSTLTPNAILDGTFIISTVAKPTTNNSGSAHATTQPKSEDTNTDLD